MDKNPHWTFSNSIRGVIAGEELDQCSNNNALEYITIATTGNSQDFGDLDHL